MWTSRQQNEVLNIVQAKKYPHFGDFFIPPKWLKFRIFYHISTPCVIIYESLLKATICSALSRALYAETITLYFQSGYFKRNVTIYNYFIRRGRGEYKWCVSV